jgi:hypothetical protein
MLCRLLIAAALATLHCVSAFAGDDTLTHWAMVGRWELAGRPNSTTCIAGNAQPGQKPNFVLLYDSIPNTWALGLAGAHRDAVLTDDHGRHWQLQGELTNDGHTTFGPLLPNFIKMLSQARHVDIDHTRYDLTGSAQAINKLRDCTQAFEGEEGDE